VSFLEKLELINVLKTVMTGKTLTIWDEIHDEIHVLQTCFNWNNGWAFYCSVEHYALYQLGIVFFLNFQHKSVSDWHYLSRSWIQQDNLPYFQSFVYSLAVICSTIVKFWFQQRVNKQYWFLNLKCDLHLQGMLMVLCTGHLAFIKWTLLMKLGWNPPCF
jgi:hypothetical protein